MPKFCMGVYSQTSPMVWGLLEKNDWTYEAGSEEDIRMEIIIVEVEAMLNDTPLTYVSSDLGNPEPLTPSYLLYGRRVQRYNNHPRRGAAIKALHQISEWTDTLNCAPEYVEN